MYQLENKFWTEGSLLKQKDKHGMLLKREHLMILECIQKHVYEHF